MRKTNRKQDAEKSKPLPTLTWKKRKQTGEQQEHGDRDQEQEQQQDEEQKGKTGRKFFACYLLTSLCPRSKRRTYIGFTVNPRRRIRQHNGEITSGAFRTKKGRPWEMVLCIYGFPTNVSALQFEWAWQHPTESLAVRAAAATFKSFTGVANKIKLMHTMLNLPNWQSFNITVNYFSTKYAKHSAICPSLPKHMKVQVFPMDELPCYTGASENSSDGEGAADAFDDGEEHGKASSESETVEANAGELQAWSMDEFPCCHRRDESFFDSEVKDSEEEYREARYTSRKVNQTHANETGQGSADTDSVDKTSSYEQYGWFKEYGKEKMTDRLSPFTRNPLDIRSSFEQFESFEVDHVQPSDFSSLPARTALQVSTDFSTRETQDEDLFNQKKKDEDLLTWTNSDVFELGWMRGKEINNNVVSDRGQESGQGPTLRHAVEIIDLLSPPPICRIGASSKNGRASPDSPLIIDSTSPICRVGASSKNRRASSVSPLIIDLT